MYSEIKQKEFEWYLRDLFFRSLYNNNNTGLVVNIQKKEIPSFLRKYLRYRQTNIEELSNLLEIVLDKLQNVNVLTIDKENIKFESKLIRKQCGKCFYINYLSKSEPYQCTRCKSSDLNEFPKTK
jgi:hypothetical protein